MSIASGSVDGIPAAEVPDVELYHPRSWLTTWVFSQDAKVIGIHMESVNHAMQTRKDLRDYIAEKSMDPQRVLVPADGQSYSF